MWTWAFNTPCKSLKGILVLFEEEKPYTRDMSKFYNPKIQKVSVIVEGKPNQLYAQGMRSFGQYDEICKYFAEGSQKDNNTNEVQKHLQLHNLSVGEYLTDRYALWLDLEHLVMLLAGPISHTSTRSIDFVEIFNIILDLSITCFSHFSGC